MKQTVRNNDYYSIAIDHERQRLYVSLRGAWRNPQAFGGYLNDINHSMDMLSSKCTCLADFTELMPYSDEVGEKVQSRAFKKLMGGRVKCSAQLMPRHFDTANILEKNGKDLGLRLNMFNSEEIAEMYLDSAS